MLDRPADANAATGPPHHAPSPPRDQAARGPSAREIPGILRRRKWAFILAVVLTPLLALVGLGQITPRYTATGTVIYDPSEYSARELQSILRVDPTTDAVMASQVEIVRSLPAAGRVAERFVLDRSPEFNWRLRPPSLLGRLRTALESTWQDWFGTAAVHRAGPTPDDVQHAVAQAVQTAITVRNLKQTRVMEVSFTTEDPALAALAANMVMDIYVTSQLDAKFDAVRRASEWLRGRVADLRREVREGEDRIAAYRAREGLVQGVQAGLGTEQISRLNGDLLQARGELAQSQARLDVARGRSGGAAQAAISPSVVQLRAQQEQIGGQLHGLLARLGPNRPRRRDDARPAGRGAARGGWRDRARGRGDRGGGAGGARPGRGAGAEPGGCPVADRPRRAGADPAQRHAARRGGFADTAEHGAGAHPADRAADRDRAARRAGDLARAAAGRAELSAHQADAGRGGRVRRVLRPAAGLAARTGRHQPAQRRRGAGAAGPALLRPGAAGLAASLGWVRVAEYGTYKPLSPFAEQLRALRAGLWLRARQPKIVAITAARPSEGKTTVAVALGRSAAINGERVVVVDCDIRQPSLAQLLDAEGKPGLVDCLLGHATLAEITQPDELSSAAFIAAGSAEIDVAGLFTSDAMRKVLEQLRAEYDLVLLDAPPALAMTDARLLARLADATVLCVRWRHTPLGVVQKAVDLLEDAQAQIAGIALTRVDARAHVRAGFADLEVYHPRYGGYFRE